ncbi:MAG TPA: S9 family peptidase [Bacillus sp. (in: firmicutes)]|uniref:S9 family peptidase n=1 Tax=Bacillus litorisediminis TaxID=2922713 RepID=UPI001FAEB859|nr:S9 family peptidase [Bacillus litorisediminis]HWO75095.1 S9 family peptidase [Bacillus sp. (in: firmicutes)]
MTEKRGIRPEDLYKLKSVTDPRLSPDGKNLVYVQTEMLKEKNDYSSNLYFISLDQKTSVAWTFGDHRNHSPRWSPAGNELVFVSNRSGKNQLYKLHLGGGEAKPLTELENGASKPVWSRDGKKIAFSVALKPDEKLGEKREEDKKKEEKEKELKPLEVVEMKYKSDASGFLDGKKGQVAILDLESGEITQLTEGVHSHDAEDWSPDGNQLLISSNQDEEKDFSFNLDLYIYNLETGEKKPLTEGKKGMFYGASWSPDGKYIAFLGNEREFENATLSKVWLYDVEHNNLKCVTDEWDVAIGDYVAADFQQGAVGPGLIWTEDSKGFFLQISQQGSTQIVHYALNGERTDLTPGNEHVYGFTVNAAGTTGVVAVSHPAHPGDLYLVDLKTGKREQLTAVNEEFLAEVELSPAESFVFKGADGWDVQGWIMKPFGFKEGEKYPMILEIHGGPHAMYANTYFHEFQVLTAQGYAVLFANPRGSHGYGQKFVNAVRGDYGGNDYNDLMAAVDYALDTFDFIDADRLGVTGGSYGGFMTNWIVGHTNRFKAAVTQRSISNWISFYGVSDIGYYFTEWQIQADLSDIEKLWKHSPLAYADKIETPLLILHSEKDYRCPIEQAEQLFIALKRQKKTTKFIRFPESNHELSRSGKPNLRLKRLEAIRDWFIEYV